MKWGESYVSTNGLLPVYNSSYVIVQPRVTQSPDSSYRAFIRNWPASPVSLRLAPSIADTGLMSLVPVTILSVAKMDQGRQRGRPKNASSPASWQKNWRERAPSNCISSETASAKSSRSRIPKHFEQPLTCFYWHRYGHCKKAGEDCW